ncbi:DUF4257 domain-containing protein [Neobacillus jeddahensis]|uniref:DUF4257 domain-containing protein n=1 Tax=Neobacillus jeddahensis TaxID=1461580 RepID=UPI00058C5888|nr:DUF4257 domain-containing protein [Neobacillus jeddahensis]
MLANIIFSVVIGGSVGLVGHVRKNGKLVMPRKTKRFLYLGFMEEVLLGAIAALLLALYTAPNSFVEMIIYSLIAGIAGDTILIRLNLVNHDNEK